MASVWNEQHTCKVSNQQRLLQNCIESLRCGLEKSSFSLATEIRVREAFECILKVALRMFRTVKLMEKFCTESHWLSECLSFRWQEAIFITRTVSQGGGAGRSPFGGCCGQKFVGKETEWDNTERFLRWPRKRWGKEIDCWRDFGWVKADNELGTEGNRECGACDKWFMITAPTYWAPILSQAQDIFFTHSLHCHN